MKSNQNMILELKSVSNLIKRRIDNIFSHEDNEMVTGMQGFIIGYLFNHKDCDVFQKDIEEEFKIRRSTATGILQLMEKNGLIKRQFVSYDARLKKLVITTKAMDRHNLFLEGVNNMENDAKKGLSDDEVKSFIITLNKIKKNIE